MDLDFDKYCVVDGSPTTVLQAPKPRSKVGNRKSNGKSKSRNNIRTINENFAEISFNRYRSASCRDVPRRSSKREGNDVLRRGSVYKSSSEVRLTKKPVQIEGRKKVEFSRGNSPGLPFGIIDSLCSSDEDNLPVEHKRSSVMSRNSDRSKISISNPCIELCNVPQDVSPLCVDNREKQSVDDACEFVAGPVDDGNSIAKRDQNVNFHKSLSAKLALSHSPGQSESDSSRASSPNTRFSPVRKMLDPFVKPKSQRSPLSSSNEYNPERKEKEHCSSVSECCSPAHLHGILTLENKIGTPFLKFSVKSPEDVYVAKTWKPENALNWVYTFHSLNHRRKINTSGWGLRNDNKEFPVVGQMQVSCYLCTELKGAGAFDNIMVTEFVLYDVSHPVKTITYSPPEVFDETRTLSCGNSEVDEVSTRTKTKELRPEHEMAAIIMQVPLEKRESLKLKSEERENDKLISQLLGVCGLEQRKASFSSSGKMHVVIPSGNHGLPSGESRGPSPLLDRWRLGGGCDCGGWDMACPLNIFGNPNIQIAEDCPPLDNQHPLELFLQGRKDNIPALTMKPTEDGQYAIDFHAQLSSLQAFSICVAVLHASDASTTIGKERNKQALQCDDSMRVFAEEEIKTLLDTIVEEEKCEVNKKMEQVLPSFVLDPPFSPIARV